MFKRIIDKPPCSIQIQFLQSFGFDCLSKIKNIELKFNQVEWESEKYSFESIALKVKTMLEGYQIIAHQIYDSFESVQLESLGHSIVKMFLQISSAIKWLIKSFTVSYQKHDKSPERIIPLRQENQSQKFRKRQISRFILKGVMKNCDSECQQDQNVDTIESLFCHNKETIRNSKNKVLSLNSSNLPILLEDTVDYLTKKSEYIEKFIALRENYEGLNRLDAPMTSQAIMQSEFELKKSESSNRLKCILNKIITFQDSKKPRTQQKSIQVSITASVSDRLKKAAEKTKIKMLYDEIESEKFLNKELKLRLEFYENKFDSKQNRENEQVQIINKKISLGVLSKKSSRFEQHSQKNSSESKQIKVEDFQDQICNMDQTEEKKVELEGEYFKNFRAFKKRSSKIVNRAHSVKQVEVNTSTSVKPTLEDNKKINCLMKIQSNVHATIVRSRKNDHLQLSSQIFSIEVILSNHNSSQNLNPLKEQDQRVQQVEKAKANFNFSKNTPSDIAQKTDYVSPPMQIIQDKFSNQFKTSAEKQSMSNFQESMNYYWRSSKTTSQNVLLKRNSSLENTFLKNTFSNEASLKEKQELKQKFENLYGQFQISKIQISVCTLCHFFINEQIAKNYQILNLSQICHFSKKIKSKQQRAKKVQTEAYRSLAFNKRNSSQRVEVQSTFHNILTIAIYHQVNRIKRTKKQLYFKILLFLRYPHSSYHRAKDLEEKFNEEEQKQFTLAELQEYLKRIRAIHSRCEASSGQLISLGWCQHMQFILGFFGLRKMEKSERILGQQYKSKQTI